MPIKIKTVFIIIVFFILILGTFLYAYSHEEDNKLTLAYISDLNLAPTPFVSQRVKHKLEKENGLLIYESQAVFQDIVKYLNEKIEPDLIIFGGNNISISTDEHDSGESLWNLFLDMAGEIKAVYLIVLGQNEIKSQSRAGLSQMLKSFGQEVHNTWWSYKFNEYLILGLDGEVFFANEKLSKPQLKWLDDALTKNKSLKTLIFVHKPLIKPDCEMIENKQIAELFKIINKNPQVVLLASGNEYLNRIKTIKNLVYVLSPSPIAYPCSFKIIEITSKTLKISTVNIALKGVIKKAERFLIESDRAKLLFPSSIKSIKPHVMGKRSDRALQIDFADLSNR